jgi:hypothetical protein
MLRLSPGSCLLTSAAHLDERDVHGELPIALQELLGAVQGVDDEAVLVAWAALHAGVGQRLLGSTVSCIAEGR